MKLEEIENEQLIDDLIDAHILGHPLFRSSDVLKAELLTRLARGEKAIKAMEEIIDQCPYDDFLCCGCVSVIEQYRGKKCTACNGRGFVFTEKLEKHTCDVCNGDGFI